MPNIDRRAFVASALAFGATALWAGPSAFASRTRWSERRDLFPEGVASGDPDPESVILWTRRPFATGVAERLTVEVARDRDFKEVIATKRTPVLAASDWTCRVLVGALQPATVYWYRFTDATGAGSRIGRTITAPRPDDDRPVRFAFVSCQSVNEGAQNAYRRKSSSRLASHSLPAPSLRPGSRKRPSTVSKTIRCARFSPSNVRAASMKTRSI